MVHLPDDELQVIATDQRIADWKIEKNGEQFVVPLTFALTSANISILLGIVFQRGKEKHKAD